MRRDISRTSKKMGKSSDRNIHIVSERLGGAFGGKAEIKKKRRARALEMAEAREGRVEAEISCKERKSELVRYLGKWLKGGERR